MRGTDRKLVTAHNQPTYNYLTQNGQVARQTWTDLDNESHVMDFIYDNNGKPYAFYYDGTLYYYITNLQGDVIRIIDTAGATICTYTYDAWGRLLNSSTNQIFKANPIRYRGYYYDTESGLYYLGSRYYDPAVKRFINADGATLAVTNSGGLTDKNYFAYCDNNPTNRSDDGGRFWETALDVISLGASIVEVCHNPTDPWAWAGMVGDAIDLIPVVTGVGEATRAVKTTIKAVDKADDVIVSAKALRRTADASSDIRKATGSYEILYKSGYSYIGKGGFDRAIKSAQRYAKKYSDEVSGIFWKSSPNHRAAFIDEYLMQSRRWGGSNPKNTLKTYNKIWSPGRGYYGK